MKSNNKFELGPIRPPSEANSLLVRFTRNCSWNRCAFCHSYRGTRFELRKPDEIKADIDAIRAVADGIESLSEKLGEGGRVTRRVMGEIAGNPAFPHEVQQVAVFLYYGGKNVFIQDANSPIMKTAQFVESLQYLKELFPSIERVTSYVRSKTLCRKTPEELVAMREAGLTRVHVGLETAHDPLLLLIRKGVTAAEHVEGGRKAKEAGLELSEYVILGAGGKRMWREHALDTAAALNQIDPHFIRVRTLAIVPGTDLDNLRREGKFEKADDIEVAREERLLIENLDGIGSRFVSDHILNLFEEIVGTLPEDQAAMLKVIDDFFDLPEREQKIFIIGRRAGVYRSLADLADEQYYQRFDSALDEFEKKGITVEDAIEQIMRNYI
jgi:biotin synthase-like enzyme